MCIITVHNSVKTFQVGQVPRFVSNRFRFSFAIIRSFIAPPYRMRYVSNSIDTQPRFINWFFLVYRVSRTSISALPRLIQVETLIVRPGRRSSNIIPRSDENAILGGIHLCTPFFIEKMKMRRIAPHD